jgi:hypothetical protein
VSELLKKWKINLTIGLANIILKFSASSKGALYQIFSSEDFFKSIFA